MTLQPFTWRYGGTRGDSRLCHWCSYHILTSTVICYWTDAQQHGTLFNPRYATGQSDRPWVWHLDAPRPIQSAHLCNEQFDWLLRENQHIKPIETDVSLNCSYLCQAFMFEVVKRTVAQVSAFPFAKKTKIWRPFCYVLLLPNCYVPSGQNKTK